jgi:hypothetical protein
MTDENKPVKVIFEPGCFDDFEGTQEELDQMIAEINAMFDGKTREEIASMSKPIDIDELLEDDPELAMKLFEKLSNNERPLQ